MPDPPSAPSSQPNHYANSFNRYRPIITRLYITENRKLSTVMAIMEKQHEFYATQRNYKKHFKAWKLSKNMRTDDMMHLARIKAKRDAVDKATKFTVYDTKVDSSKINRFIQRQKKKLGDRFAVLINDEVPTPPHIMYETEDEGPLPMRNEARHPGPGPASSVLRTSPTQDEVWESELYLQDEEGRHSPRDTGSSSYEWGVDLVDGGFLDDETYHHTLVNTGAIEVAEINRTNDDDPGEPDVSDDANPPAGRASDKFKTLEEHIQVLDKAFNELDQFGETLAQDTDSIAVEQASDNNILLDNWACQNGASVYKASRISKRITANSQLT
ncbi:hypothetical protein OIDMADRAFT_55587 [Oidiodendron maius Zn]|uniref:Clr5 domain-containing protein n=1 Tax=Oidiodendron maius (strain Zn) TaxID=913774 RepID=A0A0C3HBH4_OIDMZ|nr:hypothetical protein OIDMADRAFT_55587 [Oidiodendron maius Zn]